MLGASNLAILLHVFYMYFRSSSYSPLYKNFLGKMWSCDPSCKGPIVLLRVLAFWNTSKKFSLSHSYRAVGLFCFKVQSASQLQCCCHSKRQRTLVHVTRLPTCKGFLHKIAIIQTLLLEYCVLDYEYCLFHVVC